MKLADIMTHKVVTVEKSNSLWEVKMIFENTKFHHLLVADQGKLIGVISDRDYFKAINAQVGEQASKSVDSANLNQRVHNIMCTTLHTLTAENSVFDAIKLFNENTISCIPIVDSHMNITGILSWRDIFRFMYKKQQEI